MGFIQYFYKSGFFILAFIILLSCIGQNKNEKENAAKNGLLQFVSTYNNGNSKENSAEIVAYESQSKRLFVVNSVANQLDILDFSNPASIKKIKSVSFKSLGGGFNSVTTGKGLIAAAIENHDPQGRGKVILMDVNGNIIHQIEVGYKPDMLSFSPDYKLLLVANEGEPNDDYTIDPEGSISIIDLSKGEKNASVTEIGFKAYNDSLDVLRKRGVGIFGPNATVAQDLEPEYIAISADSKTAWITLQENNAVAKVDLTSKKLIDIYALGEKKLHLKNGDLQSAEVCPATGFYQPDGISSFTFNNRTFVVTANEGDIRMYKGYNESQKLSHESCRLDSDKFPQREKIQGKKGLGKLLVALNQGDSDGDGDLDEIYCYGGRSFSIWDENMKLVFDSGDDFERISCLEKDYCGFNEKYQEIVAEAKWDVRGPEPESVTTGRVGDKVYAFITLERFGGIMVYDITDPYHTKFVQYINSETQLTIGKSKPEGIIFISADKSPSKKNLVVIANEGTSTVDVYQVVSR